VGTIEALLSFYCERELSSQAIVLWLFFKNNSGKTHSIQEICIALHSQRNTVTKGINQLIGLRMLTRTTKANEKAYNYIPTKVKDWNFSSTTSSTPVSLEISNNTSLGRKTEDRTGRQGSTCLVGETAVLEVVHLPEKKSLATITAVEEVAMPVVKAKYTRVAEIYADESWIEIEKILEEHFGYDAIRPGRGLTKSGRYRKLRTMFLDDDFNLDAYCLYYVNKGKGFTYGLFLYPSVKFEFEKVYNTQDTYLRTATKDVEGKKEQAENSKAYIRNLLQGVESDQS